MPRTAPHGRSPTLGLLVGLVLTLVAVVAYTHYIGRQLTSLRTLQTDLVDRNRRDSLQLLRIQNNLNQLGLAMRDMLDDDHTYPLVAWSAQFQRIRGDLDDALKRQTGLAVASRTTSDRDRLTDSLAEFYGSHQLHRRRFSTAQGRSEGVGASGSSVATTSSGSPVSRST